MSGYIILNGDKVTPVHNLKTGIFYVKEQGGMVIDLWDNRVVYQK